MSKTGKQKKIFYGWLIVVGCFIIMAMSYGAINNCMGVFIKPVCEDMGFSRAGMGLTQTILSASLMVMSLVSGRIFSRLDVTLALRIGCIFMAGGYFCFSFANSLLMFYGAALVTGIAEGLMVTVALSMLINNWFRTRRGFAVGMAFMGSGVGGMICNPLASQLIIHYGWRTAYQILAVVIFLLVVPVCFFIIRTRPADKGLVPYGETGGEEEDFSQVEKQGVYYRHAVRTPQFWMICICAALNTICTSGLMQNTAPHVSDVGYSPTFAASVASCGMGALAIGKLALGWLYDKLGAEKATVVAHISAGVALAGALMAPAMPGIGLIVLGTGLGGAFGNVAHPIIAQIVYGNRDFGSILGMISAFANIGGMLCPVLVGGSYDVLHSYKPAFSAMIVLLCLITLAYMWAFRTQDKALEKRGFVVARKEKN